MSETLSRLRNARWLLTFFLIIAAVGLAVVLGNPAARATPYELRELQLLSGDPTAPPGSEPTDPDPGTIGNQCIPQLGEIAMLALQNNTMYHFAVSAFDNCQPVDPDASCTFAYEKYNPRTQTWSSPVVQSSETYLVTYGRVTLQTCHDIQPAWNIPITPGHWKVTITHINAIHLDVMRVRHFTIGLSGHLDPWPSV